jgi:hypothetical protein
MRHLIVPVALLVLLFYLVDDYYTHGAYFRAVRNAVVDIF